MTKFELVINSKAAKGLGLPLPQMPRATADELNPPWNRNFAA
jgi:hypothetical protein